jgi:gluconokinase
MPTVSPSAAEAPLVLALDLGTSSFRALLFDRQGRAVEWSEEQIGHTIRTTPDGGAEADADHLMGLLGRCVDGAMARARERSGDIRAVGISCFWHGLLGVDREGRPLTPVYFWADRRSALQARALRTELGAEVHARTGCAFHSSYWPAKLRWLRETAPETFRRVARWQGFSEFAAERLFGERPARASFAMASGTGLLDVRRLTWDEPLLNAVKIRPEQLPPLVDRDEAHPTLASPYASRWGPLRRVPWYPAIGDGACANVGSGAVGPGRIAVTLGTSGAVRIVIETAGRRDGGTAGTDSPAVPPSGRPAAPLWSYRLDRERAVVGGAISNGGIFMGWLRNLMGADIGDETIAEAEAQEPDEHGLTLLPFLTGERYPPHVDRAAGVIAGLTLATTPADLLRAGMEAVSYRLARIYERLKPLAAPEHTIVANGGALLHSPAWLQMTADVFGHNLIALPAKDEASARGAALLALQSSGSVPDLAAALDPATSPDATVYAADPYRHATYRAALTRGARLERLLYSDAGSWDEPPAER